MATGMEENRVFYVVGTNEGQGGVNPGESVGEGVGVVKEKEMERPSGSEIGKELDLMLVRSDVSREGGGTSKEKKTGRPEGFKNKEKITVENDVEAMQMGGAAGGDCSGVRGKKRGRPKGSKNKKKYSVRNDVEAMQMGSDISCEGGLVVRGKKVGSPSDSEKRMKIAVENEVAEKVDGVSSEHGDEVVVKKDDAKNVFAVPVGDVNSEFDEGIVVKKDDGRVKIVGVGGRGEVLGTGASMPPVRNMDNFQGNFGVALNEDVIINVDIGESGRIPEFGGLGSQGGDLIVRSNSERGIPEGSGVSGNRKMSVEVDNSTADNEVTIDGQVRRPLDSQDKNKNAGGGNGAVERKGKRGRPKGSKNRNVKGEKESPQNTNTVVCYDKGEEKIAEGKKLDMHNHSMCNEFKGVLGGASGVDGDINRVDKSIDPRGGAEGSKNKSIAVEADGEISIDPSLGFETGAEPVKKDRRGRPKGSKNRKTLAANENQLDLGSGSKCTGSMGMVPKALRENDGLVSSGETLVLSKEENLVTGIGSGEEVKEGSKQT